MLGQVAAEQAIQTAIGLPLLVREVDQGDPLACQRIEGGQPRAIFFDIPGEEEKFQKLNSAYAGTMGGLHDLFPTIAHLLGESPPVGPWGTHLFVENEKRAALPLPEPPGYFGYQGALSLGDGDVIQSPQQSGGSTQLPSSESVMQLRTASESFLDHYSDLAAQWETDADPAFAETVASH